jgi:hypothetical protein
MLLFSMIDLIDLWHYLVGIIIVSFLIWIIIKVHLYFSKDNILIEELLNKQLNN